jgi:hypothetical protein
MTSTQEPLTDVARQSQEAFTKPLQAWSDMMQTFTRSLTGGQFRLPDAQALVDNMFDFAEQVLASQREFTKTLLAASVQAGEAVGEQTTRVTESGRER